MRLFIVALGVAVSTATHAQQPGEYTATIDGMTSFAAIGLDRIHVSQSIAVPGGGISYRIYPPTVKGCSLSFRAEGIHFNLCAGGEIIDSKGRKRGTYRRRN